MEHIEFKNTKITGGFWKKKQDMVRNTSIHAVYDRFADTGRFDAFKCNWKEGKPNKPHYFWDSDVAKWIEGASYLISLKREPKLERIIDKTVNLIEKNQGEDGYFNIYFTVVEPDKRFKVRHMHELYCAGHLMEASVAYYEATGKRKFLDLMIKYTDYIYDRFYVKKDTGFATPGHEEIELALVKMYKCTGDEKYLTLSKYFIDERGKHPDLDKEQTNPHLNQSHLPLREQKEATGHAVRMMYICSAMADVAKITSDAELLSACKALFSDITEKKMYITGGVGSSGTGEAFTIPYDLPNLSAYAETCASIGLVFFASRMLENELDSTYADVIERIIYNGFMSSTSLDGKAFFYENRLEIIPYLATKDDNNTNEKSRYGGRIVRQEVFPCSCCPPNITRFIPSIANYLYTYDDTTLYVHQFMQSKTECSLFGKRITIVQRTNYPESGKVKITITGGDIKVGVRVPYWSEKAFVTNKGYVMFDVKDGDTIELDFGMPTRIIEARREVTFDGGLYALMRGPVLYCLEGVDNITPIKDLRIDPKSKFFQGKNEELDIPTIMCDAYYRPENPNAPLYSNINLKLEKTKAKFIPYYAFGNRGLCEMSVWFNIIYRK